MRKTLIITGGEVNLTFAKEYCEREEFNYYIVADNGLKVADALNIIPNYIVGDFDTVSPFLLSKYQNRENIILQQFRAEKDFTDTQAAVSIAIEGESSSIHILGATGSRLDHTLANILLLQTTLENGIETVIVGEHNRIRMLGNNFRCLTLRKSEYKYVSLIPVSEVVTDITTAGMKYNVEHYDMYIDKEISRGVSNEISGKEGRVSIREGKLLIIESKD